MAASQEMTNEKLEMQINCVVWKGGIRGLINHTVFVKGYVATSVGAQAALAIHTFTKKAIILYQPDWS